MVIKKSPFRDTPLRFCAKNQLAVACTATEMIPTVEMIPTTEMTPAVTTEMIPGISGMELRGLKKLDNNLERAFYLFILHLFYGV